MRGFVVLALILTITGCSRQQTATGTPKQPQQQPSGHTVLTTENTNRLCGWEGNSVKTTEPFTVNKSPWVIGWATDGAGVFQIYLHRPNGELVSVAANVQGKGSDESYVYETGTFYLMINTTQVYSASIYEPK
jgi:hypothetical protein